MLATPADADIQTRLNVRVGKRFKEKYNKYLEDHEISGANFTRAALDYWMQVDGCPNNAELKIQHLQELLSEKERTISILQDQINLLRDQIKLQNNQPISQCINSPGLLNKNTISIKSKNNKDS